MLGVHKKDNGTFWLIDRDSFKNFSNFDIAKTVNPEYYTKSFMTKLSPGKSDDVSFEAKEADLFHHQTFVIKLKDIFVINEEKKYWK